MHSRCSATPAPWSGTRCPASSVPRRPANSGWCGGVAAADGSVGRIFDGHLNAVERLAVQAPPERDRELEAVRAGGLLAGVWGGDPRPGEGPPAGVVRSRSGDVLRGVKTFCSGAGGLDRALVLARDPDGGPPPAVWVDLRDGERVEVDEGWYRGYGLRASVSHRVVFHDARILARFGAPGALAESPGSAATHCGRRAPGPEWPTPRPRRALRRAGDSTRARCARGRAARIETARARSRCGSTPPPRRWTVRIDLPGVALHGRAGDRARVPHAARRGIHARAARARSPRQGPSTARGATSSCSCSSTGSTRCSRAAAGALDRRRGEPRCAGVLRGSLYRADPDPWDFETSDYERAKYAATLAACGAGPFDRALELGASIGVLTERLAPRCGALVAIDVAPTAIAQARGRLAGLRHVTVIAARSRRTSPAASST